MKRFLSILLVCMMICVPAFAEDTEENADNSWSQINRAVGKDENWVQLQTDGRFHLGDRQPMEGFDGLYIGSWSTFPSMDGSTVCVPMGMELARQWLRLPEDDLNGFINFSTTPYAYDRLIQGKPNPTVTVKSRNTMMDDRHPIDLVLATYPNADERQAAADAGVELVYVPFCCDAFVFMVNEANPVESLTTKQIQEIYTGKHTTWATLGGNPQELFAYQRPHGSGSQTAMEEMVMQGLEIQDAMPNYVSEGMSEAVQQIGNYDNGPGAIGYSYLYYVNTLVENSGIRVLAIDGVAPTAENLQSGAYPYTVNYYAVYRKGDENTEAFVNWLIGEEGQKAVRQAGYVPLRALPADADKASEKTEKSLTRQDILLELGKLFVNSMEELSVFSDDDLIALGKLFLGGDMQEELPNMSHEECVSALRELGIEIPEQAVQDTENYLTSMRRIYFSDSTDYEEGIGEFPMTLLTVVGMGEYDYDTGVWTPTSKDVYAFDVEVFDIANMYHLFLQGVASIVPGFEPEDVQEVIQVQPAKSGEENRFFSSDGTTTVSFTLNGKRFERVLDFYGDWFNDCVILWINEILKQEGFSGQLHGFSDGMQGLILLYGDDAFLEKVNTIIPKTYNWLYNF